MPTTTNNGWDIPADTDLVKDGALAIRTLGQDIDTTLGVYAAPGLVHINTTSFSAVSSQSVNSVFSSTYTNYKIITNITATSNTGDTGLRLRLRVSGTDNSSGIYRMNEVYVVSTSSTITNDAGGSNTYFTIGHIDDSAPGTFIISELGRPFVAARTNYINHQTVIRNGGDSRSSWMSGNHDTATSYDGFTIYPDTGNITGSVSVYAYK